MRISEIKHHLAEEYTPMAWERVQLKLMNEVQNFDDSTILDNATYEKINQAIKSIYGRELSMKFSH